MIANGVQESTEEPPNVPMITGTVPKRAKRESLHDVVVDAAKAMADIHRITCNITCMVLYTIHLLWHTPQLPLSDHCHSVTTATSVVTIFPSCLADVRLKHYEQLRYLHKMCDDGILSEEEFLEQKGKIMDSLRLL